MIYLYDCDGNCQGKFDWSKSIEIASNREHNDSRWQELIRTASGNYVIANITCWQGEKNSYEATTKAVAIEIMEEWGCSEADIKDEFPEYQPEETY